MAEQWVAGIDLSADRRRAKAAPPRLGRFLNVAIRRKKIKKGQPDHHVRHARGGLPPVVFELEQVLGQPDPERVQVQARDLVVEMLGQHLPVWFAAQVLLLQDRSPPHRRGPVRGRAKTIPPMPSTTTAHRSRPHHQRSEPWPIVPSRISPDEVSGNSLCTGWSRTLSSMVTNGPLHFGTRS
jgi:hypothetical protein